jgi:hypothetical protein
MGLNSGVIDENSAGEIKLTPVPRLRGQDGNSTLFWTGACVRHNILILLWILVADMRWRSEVMSHALRQ